MDFIKELRIKWITGSMLIKLVFVNVAVFLLLHLLTFVLGFTSLNPEKALLMVELPSDLGSFLRVPWTIITYMFSQYDLLHILFNMLWLYWFGEIFLLADSSKSMLALYLYGGLGGGILFMLCYTMFGLYGLIIGSSASVLAIVVATAVRHPDYKMNLLLLGEISLKWVAIATIVIDFISIGGSNSGGHIAHIGGAIMGIWYALAQKNGIDITRPYCIAADRIINLRNRLFDRIYKFYGAKPAFRSSKSKPDEACLDEILDKVKKSGYGSLTKQEKDRLFDVSRRIK